MAEETVAEAIRRRLKALKPLGWNQGTLAASTGLSEQTVCAHLNGRTPIGDHRAMAYDKALKAGEAELEAHVRETTTI